ncbi:HesB/YadR/YfhF family protein [Salinicoccus roseus]|uniref:HesB/YadR/YfhF family protein n=1 Tax=Salinicoccus roseus TaxID=45670 RepID=UPI001EF41A60|nr:iron-sulfur cluster biosynthesis family protein [Salinicoccus roseus]
MIEMLEVTDRALDWMKEELDPEEGQGVNIYVRYGGETQLKQGFSPALTVERLPSDSKVFDYDGIQVFIKESDLWYFEDAELVIDSEDDEVIFESR